MKSSLDDNNDMTIKNHHNSNLMSDIVSNEHLNKAFELIYKQRIKDNANSDMWSLSLNWDTRRQWIRGSLLTGRYQLSPVIAYCSNKGRLTRWSSEDAVVLKAISLKLAVQFECLIDQKCYHLKGRGGLPAAVKSVKQHIKPYGFVLKSDVADFYDSMDHDIVLQHCRSVISDKHVLRIIAQYLNRVEVQEGEHSLIEKGIPKGCPLSPLMGALMLKSLDDSLPEKCFYARYMDDWVILVKTRGQLRRVVKKMHRVMQTLKFKLALDKTYIGKTSNGFDFLGYRFNHRGLIGLASKTVQNFIERMLKLYEQGATTERIQVYVRRWWSCVVVLLMGMEASRGVLVSVYYRK